MLFSSLVPTLTKGYLKNEYLKINDIFLVKKEWLKKKNLMVESLLFCGSWSSGSATLGIVQYLAGCQDSNPSCCDRSQVCYQ